MKYCSKFVEPSITAPFTIPIRHPEEIDNDLALHEGISSQQSEDDAWISALNYDDAEDVVVDDEEWLPIDVEGGDDEDAEVKLTQGDYKSCTCKCLQRNNGSDKTIFD